MNLTNLEREVMAMLLAGDDPTLRTLAAQLSVARVAGREFTGSGFFTTFDVPPEACRLEHGKMSFSFGDVAAHLPALRHGAGFVLHVRGGTLHSLEGYSYDEPWPAGIDGFQLSYVRPGTRDLVALRKKWQEK